VLIHIVIADQIENDLLGCFN